MKLLNKTICGYITMDKLVDMVMCGILFVPLVIFVAIIITLMW